MMNKEISIYEEIYLNAHPSLQTHIYDGWVLRFANGYTSRANSVNMLYPSKFPLPEKIVYCEKLYFSRGLPAIFRIHEGMDSIYDKTLEQQGYQILTPTYTMAMDLTEKSFCKGDCFISNHAGPEWFAAIYALNEMTDRVKTKTFKRIIENVINPMRCGRLVKDRKTVACGSLVLERGYMGLLYIVVDKSQRGRGYGREICESLLAAAKELGAHTAYLQVLQSNQTAINLYDKLGYEILYPYWYRIKTK